MQQKNVKVFIFPIIALFTFLMLVFGAAYAYFSSAITMNTSNYQVVLPKVTSLVCTKKDCNVTVTPAMMTTGNYNSTTPKTTSNCYVDCTCSGTSGAVCTYNVSLWESGKPYVPSATLSTGKEFTATINAPSTCSYLNSSNVETQVNTLRGKKVASCSLEVPAGGSVSANVSAEFKWYNLNLDQSISASQNFNYELLSGNVLPDAYQQVDYITLNGNLYINTGVTYGSNVVIYDRISYTELNSSQTYVISGVASAVYWGIQKKSNVWYWTCGGANTTYKPTANTIYDLRVELGNKKLYVNGVMVDTRTAAVSGSGNIYLFAAKNAGNTTPGYFEEKVRRYNTKIFVNNSLDRDLVPCYRKEDNVVGMYDLVHDVFYTKEGDGTLSAGSNM